MSRNDLPEKNGDPRPAIPANLPRVGTTGVFEGDFSAAEDFCVQGRFKGTLRIPEANLYVDRNARVEAAVTARDVYIYGTLVGPIQASGRVFLAAESDVKGDISAARLSVENGARFRGGVLTGQSKSG
ncbi:MAG: polymer-forming cytoskeletal protein [Candidatus Aminicenantes bacterium]|nr:polymer-forming cytoskeletal protein [Candidatus Aminicenantes bacterium]